MDMQAQAVGSDADIVRQVLAGDVDAFEHLLVKYKGYVLSIVGRHVPLMDVEEVAQDANEDGWTKWKKPRRACHSRFTALPPHPAER